MTDWAHFLTAMTLTLVRVSGMVLFAPFFSSTALPVRTKAVFAGAVAFLLAPLVAALPNAQVSLSFASILGELAVGLVYGLSLALLSEMLLFAGQIAGLQFSFSLVNLMDPTTSIQTPLLGDLFQIMGTLVVITAGLDRILLASMVRSFHAVPLGSFALAPPVALAIVRAAAGIFLAAARAGRAGAGRDPAGRGCGGADGQAQPATAGHDADRSTQDSYRICDSDRLAGAVAAVHRSALCRLLDMAERLMRPVRNERLGDARRTHRTGHPHRREKARKEGDILHSRELTAAAGTLAGVMALGSLGPRIISAWRTAFAGFLALGASSRWEPSTTAPTLIALRRLTISVLGPTAVAMACVALAALTTGALQTGGLTVHGNAVGFKLDRINPVSNIKNLFSLRAAARLAKSLIPAGLLAVFAVQRIARQLTLPPFSMARLELLGSDVYGLLLTAAWLLFAWSAIDYLVEWQSRESRLKMSKQDLRDEYKETEGSPQIRSRIRGLQRQMRRRRVKADVSKAAVVLTNPTHYAVALGFDFVAMDAPRVLAKGRNLLAEEIKAEARWAGVPIVENPPLARSLYRSVEVGQAIPVDLYAAVAAILAYLYRQRVEAELRERQRASAASSSPGGSR